MEVQLQLEVAKLPLGVARAAVYGIQDAAAISNETLVYKFQGFTEDEQCYVNASFSLTHSDLEEYAEIPMDVYTDSTGTALQTYFMEYQELLDSNPGGFSPDLSRFDEIINAIEVDFCMGG